MKKLIFTDKNENNCELHCCKEDVLIIWPAGTDRSVFITPNQAEDLANVLKFWAKNKKLPYGEIKFDLEYTDPTKVVAFSPFTDY